MPKSLHAATAVARLSADETTAKRVADLLTEHCDPDDTAIAVFEIAEGAWDVAAHFRTAPDEAWLRGLVAQAAGPAAARSLTFETVAARDWVAASLEGLKPVAAGRFLVHGAHDRARVKPNIIGIEIEAALAFGTGHHGTTRGCLLALDHVLKSRKPRRVLDVGTGTGVLAIAAARAMRREVLATDIDPLAVAVARANARLNRAAPFVTMIHAAGLGAQTIRARAPYDLVLANILLGPLKLLARPMRRLLAPHARIVLSGLLTAHANAALAAYRAQGLTLERRIVLDGWTTLILMRGGPR